ncbi:MAG TPA: ATP-binding protein, partial [Blastocatellia bacterium]
MNDSIDPNLESLPGWALSALEAALSPPPSKSALDHRGTAAWPLMMDAAVISDFLPRDLAHDAGVVEENRAEVEKIVLGFAETSYGPDGVRWSLRQPTRAEVLEAASQTADLEQAITRTASRFNDPISKALRECLTTGPSDSVTSTPNSLEATRVAVALLSGVSWVKLPKLEDLDQEIQLRRLMKPFERMIGRDTNDTGSNMADRFFGRGEEMERLRDYVGVIPADSIIGSMKRGLNWVSRTIKGRAPMMVWGVGGVGKTTLISKFMLEHANAAASRFPFAYLDFDRATISARRRLGLLAEMCLQTGAQFEELSEPLANLRSRALTLARKLESKQEFEWQTYVTPFTLEFRKLIDDHLNMLETRLEWARPFLLVFDTFEVVQYAQDDVLGLEEFIHGFSKQGENGAWPRLRLIISGRKNVTNFMGTVEDLPLGALDPEGSAKMMLAIARDGDKSISRADAKRLISALAKATGERNGGVQPLRLRLIGEVFQKEQENGPSIVRSLVKELKQPLTSDGLAAQALIDGILIRRVLSHVGDPRVKALADPGLVVRFITPDVIKEVMTPGAPNPSAGEPKDADANTAEPWIIDQTEAKSIFDAFSKDVSLVEVEEAGLRHRPDVRRQMLPLIRARRPKQFEALNRLAFDYFSAKAERDEKDLVSAAEAVYHGLWLNEPLSKLNRLWRNSPIFDPRIDPEEFDEGGPANIFLRAKARAALTSNEVSGLPRGVALDWLDTRNADLLEDHRIEEAIGAIRTAAGDSYEALDDRIGTAAVLARLLYRTGSWNDAVQLALRHLKPVYDAKLEKLSGTDEKEALLSLLRTWATIVG